MANNYNWNIENLIYFFMPNIKKFPKRFAWIKALLWPLNELHGFFLQYVIDKRYELDFTGQVISLERLLNDKYDDTLRRIFISSAVATEAYFFDEDDDFDTDIFLFDEDDSPEDTDIFLFDGFDSGVSNFTINIPSDVVFTEAELRALINKYKLAGKYYTIKIF